MNNGLPAMKEETMTPSGSAIEIATERLLDHLEEEGKKKFEGEFPRDNYRDGFRRYVRIAVGAYLANDPTRKALEDALKKIANYPRSLNDHEDEMVQIARAALASQKEGKK